MKTQYRSLLILLVLLWSTALLAQTPRPKLTTEDVMKWRAANPDRAEHFIPEQDTAQQKSQAEFLAAEKDWNARLNEARAKVRDFERLADQTTLAAAQARNVIFHNDPNALNANNARVADLQAQARAYRAEARGAQAAVNQLLDEGKQYGYQLYTLSPTLPNGEPNLEYYRARFLTLQRDLQDTQARADVLRLRANRTQTTVNTTWNSVQYPGRRGIQFYPNNGAADVFYLNRLRDQWGGINDDLQATQALVVALTEQLEALQEEGRRAGVPPGIFR